jgi:hypothetical protein
MTPSEWGPPIWNFLHSIGNYYPANPSEAQRAAAISLFKSMGRFLPCEECQQFYANFITSNPPPVEKGGEALLDYVTDLHNAVNEKLGKSRWPRFLSRLRHSALARSFWFALVLAVLLTLLLIRFRS